MTDPLRVGTRRSPLARAQTELVLTALRQRAPDRRFLVVPLTTAGDRTRVGGVPLDFTGRIDRAVEAGDVDLAVHSAKDLPARTPLDVRVAAYPRRADPRDCLVLRQAGALHALPAGASVGSSSLRRRAQLLRARPDLNVREVRGNVESRIRLVWDSGFDGVILARAGLLRLGRGEEVSEILDRRRFLPAPGQGALAVTVRRGDRALEAFVRSIDDRPTRVAVTAECSFSEAVGGDCNLPLGALGTVDQDRLRIRGEVLSADGVRSVAGTRSGDAADAGTLGRRLAEDLERAGARELLAHPSGAG